MRFPTVLLAEDEPIIAMDIRYLLEGTGLRVIEANDMQSIMEACKTERPDLAIFNFKQQHNRNGMALANLLKSHFTLPVMFITGARRQDITTSKDFDSSIDILYKPFTRAQLRQCVNRQLA